MYSEQGQEILPTSLVERYHLGAIEQVFTIKPIGQQAGAMLCGVLGVVCVGISFVIWVSGWIIFWLLTGTALLALMVLFIRSAQRYRGAKYFVCLDGLLRIDKEEIEVVRWENVLEVRKVLEEYTSRSRYSSTIRYRLTQYHIRQLDGQEFVIQHDLMQLGSLLIALKWRIVQQLLPGALETYNADQPVHFGSIEVSKQGITVQNGWRTLAWSDLLNIKIDAGTMIIQKKVTRYTGEMWEKIHTSGMPNLALFAALVRQIAGKLKVFGDSL